LNYKVFITSFSDISKIENIITWISNEIHLLN